MSGNRSRASGIGLERLCGENEALADWMRSTAAEHGVEILEARFHGQAYHKHRHDTYAICLTTVGVQRFFYRGASEVSLPGQVVVLHPDELHDGYAGTDGAFGYRILYVDPALVFEAVQTVCGRASALPFVRAPVIMHQDVTQRFSAAIMGAFHGRREPLAIDSLVLQLAEGLVEADPRCRQSALSRHLDVVAVKRAQQFLDAQRTRVVHSAELEAVTGLTRYELARQFRLMHGTSPHRYLLMRRLDYAREQLTGHRALAEVAIEAGFADQAHFSRMFKAAYGITPARYMSLRGPVPARAWQEGRAGEESRPPACAFEGMPSNTNLTGQARGCGQVV